MTLLLATNKATRAGVGMANACDPIRATTSQGWPDHDAVNAAFMAYLLCWWLLHVAAPVQQHGHTVQPVEHGGKVDGQHALLQHDSRSTDIPLYIVCCRLSRVH